MEQLLLLLLLQLARSPASRRAAERAAAAAAAAAESSKDEEARCMLKKGKTFSLSLPPSLSLWAGADQLPLWALGLFLALFASGRDSRERGQGERREQNTEKH